MVLRTLIAVATVTGIMLAGSLALSTGTGTSGCAIGTVDVAAATTVPAVDGYGGDQLTNAAHIMNAATAQGLPARAQILGVMTAMGESSLRNLTYGDDIHGVTNPDGTPTTSIGLFQQQDSWGSRAVRLDPSQAAALFFTRLAAVAGWELLEPTEAAHRVQRNADPDHYTRYFAPATDIVRTLTAAAGGGDCAITGNAQALAQELVDHADNGTLTGLVPDHIKEIRWIAHGETVDGCGIDTAILQVMVVAVRTFDTVGVSSINRRCTGDTPGAGTASRHWLGGGGYAVDFYSLNGRSLTGSDAHSLRLIGLLDPIMPDGSRVGQADCRAHEGRTLHLTRLTQIPDECNHLHIDVDPTGSPLRLA
jgi:hypothetical protein